LSSTLQSLFALQVGLDEDDGDQENAADQLLGV
jgi:hypothetical protein